MSKSDAEIWWAIRIPKKTEGGPKKEIGPRTHGDARATAKAWYWDGYKVELRRRRAGEKDHIVIPKFALPASQCEKKRSA